MSSVLTQMQGNEIRAGILGTQCRLKRIRIPGVALLAQRRNVIDIDAKLHH
jgi:hypothetical protein